MTTYTITDTVTAALMSGPHEITDDAKYEALAADMTSRGWAGPPVVVVDDPDDGMIPVTGSHRIPAAQEAGVQVPVVDIRELLPTGVDLDEIRDDAGIEPGRVPDWAIGLAMAAAEHIPAATRDAYGLDLH